MLLVKLVPWSEGGEDDDSILATEVWNERGRVGIINLMNGRKAIWKIGIG